MPNRHRVVFLTKPRESAENKSQRLRAAKEHQEYRSEKARRRKGYSKTELLAINTYRQLGIDYAIGEPFQQVPQKLEGVSIERLSQSSLAFLAYNFPVEIMQDREGRKMLHFKSKKERKGDDVNLIKQLAEVSEVPRKQVKEVYKALVSTIEEGLKEDRRVRLPEIGVISIRFRPAREGGKRPNPFKKGTMMKVKSRKASNKLRATLSKSLKEFVEELPVINPKKKKK